MKNEYICINNFIKKFGLNNSNKDDDKLTKFLC